MIPVRLIIFDLDGTLVDTLGDITASTNYALQKLGKPPQPLERVREFIGGGIRDLMSRSLGGRDDLLDEAVGIYIVHHSKNLLVRSRLYPGVRETLDHFRSIPLAVVSNKSREFVLPLMEGLGIAGSFRMLVGAGEGIALKPAPDTLVHITRTLDILPERTLMVGDGTTDIRAGRAAGAITCAVTYGYRSEDELRREGPDFVTGDIREIAKLFAPEPAA